MPKLGEVARVTEDKNLSRAQAAAVTLEIVAAHIDQEPGLTNAQLAKHFYPNKERNTAQTYMSAKLKRWSDRGKLVRRRYNGTFHYYPYNFVVPGDPKLPGDVTKSFMCPETGCGRRFKTPQARGAHLRKHRYERPSAVQQVTDYLREHPGARYREIVAGTGLSSGTVGSSLARIKDRGLITNRDGHYYLGEAPEATQKPIGLLQLAKEYVWQNSYRSDDLPAVKRFVEWVEKLKEVK